MTVTKLRLNKRQERRIQRGHGWVFSNEIDTGRTPLKAIEPGQPVVLESSSGKFLAHAYANPHSLISARVTSRDPRKVFDQSVLEERLQLALALRRDRYKEPFYRLVYGEGDYLPGLIVDRYDDVLVVQINTAGMECYKDSIVSMLQAMCSVRSIYLRNDAAARELEKLPLYRDWVYGQAVDVLQVRENKLQFVVPSELSQKTGWFYDHRNSRAALAQWVRGKRVLDVYSYVGAFGIHAASYGADHVLALDASADAISAATQNAERNQVQQRFEARCIDALEGMRTLFEQGERFDLVILDPPAFVKRRKDRELGLQHYCLVNQLAMRLLSPAGGLIVSASCSQAVDQSDLLQQMRKGLPKGRLGLQVLASLQQGEDHPIHVAMPETRYLCGAIARII